MITLTNGSLSASVKEAGAELCSLKDNASGLEYIWQAGRAWPKHSPVLFPIVGSLKNDSYIYEDNIYKLERHGFARNKIFTVVHCDAQSAVLELKWTEETLPIYPFKFSLKIKYCLSSEGLTVSFITMNEGEKQMLFSIGAHPAFRVPLKENEMYDDYFLHFSRKEHAQRWTLTNGLIDSPVSIFNDQNELPLSHGLFYQDALVFKGLRSNIISIRSRKGSNGIDFSFDDYPYFGIWAARDADFVCLEPWHGIADSVNSSQDLLNKEGIRKLDAGKQFVCSFNIKIY